MPFCIMRTQKIKSVGGVCAAISHSFRDRKTPNADPSKTPENTYSVDKCEVAIAKYLEELPEKRRKNAVVGVELMMTFSPEWKESPNYTPEKYLQACDQWAKDLFGEKNIILVSHHYDETTPHASIIVCPKDENGKLNCRKFLGGTRERMRAYQDDFYEHVGKQFALDRGVEHSRAKHQDIKSFYSAIEQTKQDAYDISVQIAEGLPKKAFLEWNSDYVKKVKSQIAHDLTPIIAKHLNAPSEAQHTRELNRTLALTLERTKEETRQAVTQEVTQKLTDNYSADLERAVQERTREQAEAVARAQRELRDLQRANLLKEQEEKEEKARKAKEERARQAKEQREKEEKEQKERIEKEQKAREEQAKNGELKRLREENIFFHKTTTPEWYIKTGQEMQENGCKNYTQLLIHRVLEKKRQERAIQERKEILEKGFIGVGWELTERGTIELFTREMYGRNRATKPFFELVEKEWIDALTAGRNPKVGEKYYVNMLQKLNGKVQAVGCFHETTRGRHL